MKTFQTFVTLLKLHLLFGAGLLSGQDNHLIVLEKCLEKREAFSSMKFDLEFKRKSFSKDDTMSPVANVELVRVDNDSLFGGYCSIVLDTTWYVYDGTKILRVLPRQQLIEFAVASEMPSMFIKGTWVDNFIEYGFLKRSRGIMQYFQDESITWSSSDTMIGSWPCIGYTFQLPDDQGIYDQVFFLAIDTIEYICRNKMYKAFFQGNEQYSNWQYSNVQYGYKNHIDLFDKINASGFTSIDRSFIDTTDQAKSRNNYDFSSLKGEILSQGNAFDMKEVKAKYIILDFWYTSCMPCIKAIPTVNEIYNAYKDRGVVVFGVNPLDDPIKKKDRLDKFLLNNPMGYPTVMVGQDVGASVCWDGYPTFIILDEAYQVVYKDSGFSEHLFNEVSAFLDQALK